MARKLYIKTHGCQMNDHDSQRMGDLLQASDGYELTDDPAAADLLLLNTCSVREKAQEKVFHELGRWRAFKQARPGVQIGVGGCVASQEGAAIYDRAPFVDVVFGPQTLHRLPELLKVDQPGPVVDVSFPEIEKFDRLPAPKVEGPCAYVSVMEGCSKYCSFCVVPYTRGEEVSRPLDTVMAEVHTLARQGVREITFLGQNVNGYRGALTAADPAGELADFAELIELTAEVDGIDRIRYTTSHPLHMTPALIDVYREVPQLVSHLHLPVQSGSDRILAAMKRGHTVLEYRATIRALRAARPDLSLSGDFIIGFPGETEADFEKTAELIGECQYDASFSFVYSPRPGTPAASLPDDVDMAVKKQRLAIVQDRLRAQAFAISRAMVGSQQSVLITGRSNRDPGQLRGRTENNRVVNFSCADDGLIGRFATVGIAEALPNSLRGQLVSAE